MAAVQPILWPTTAAPQLMLPAVVLQGEGDARDADAVLHTFGQML